MFPATTKSGGVNVTTGPLDVCKTPSPGAPIPLPYANLVDGLAASGDKAAKRTQKVIIDDAARKGYFAKSATAAAVDLSPTTDPRSTASAFLTWSSVTSESRRRRARSAKTGFDP